MRGCVDASQDALRGIFVKVHSAKEKDSLTGILFACHFWGGDCQTVRRQTSDVRLLIGIALR